MSLIFAGCDAEYNTVYTVSVPDRTMQFSYYLHTDDIQFIDGGKCIRFVPKEDSSQVYTFCDNFTIEKNR